MGTSEFDLSGRVAIVTGGGSGIGQHLAHALAEHGARVAVVDIVSALADTVAGELAARGTEALAVQADGCQPADVGRLVDATVARFGTVDILVNNAGGRRRDALPSALDVWRQTIDLSLTSAFLCSRQVAPVMVRQGRGRIINMASVYGLVGRDERLYTSAADVTSTLAYAAAKGGIVNLTRALAAHLGPHRITVNAVAPGMVKTARTAAGTDEATWARLAERTPVRRPGRPEDYRGAVVYLASAAAEFVTGHTLVVDGGWTVW